MTREPAFYAAMWGGTKRRLGIDGKAPVVRLEPGAIAIEGERGSRARIPFGRIQRIRVGFEESKTGTVLQTKLWLARESKHYGLGSAGNRRDYGNFVRAAVAEMLRDAPQIAIETGSSLFVPIFLIGAFGTMSLAALAFMIYLAATGDDWTIGLGGFAVAAILLAILGPWAWSRHRPRRIQRLEEIERALPGC